ncbi:unnamed protein product [Ilex paraguariensis]|uniref:Leucine-rich repeat-containing N-terminal plant-type domain-containing protein n=1 Tax=Ilex paraguariensis TaxID=185542 RepID=A0ABC8T3S1_9AQUA
MPKHLIGEAMGTPATVLVVLFSILFMEVLEFSYSIASHPNVNCIESEQKALVKFRESLTDESNRLSSWVGEDCCTWKGVVCSNKTGHVLRLDLHNPFDDLANFSKTCLGGEINPSLLNLKHLSHLDLSMNNFSGTQIPKFLGSLQNLRYLNLSNSGFGGNIPHHLGNLSSLRYLDLSDFFYNDLTVDNLLWVSKLSSLKHLDISEISIGEGTDWLQPINMLSSLSVLKLTGCQLYTIPPLSYVNFTSLSSLDLQSNSFDSTIPLWLSNITGLLRLHLDDNRFHGPIPDTLGRLSSLTHIGLSDNSFNTSMPSSLGNLSSLVLLDLFGNEFQGSLQTTIKNLCRLHVLDLSNNNFSGEIPSLEGGPFGCHKNLERLLLSRNSIHGPIPVSIGRLLRLRELDVSRNQLNGSIPLSLGQLSKLEMLDVSHNYLAGMVSEYHFTKLTRLNTLSMSFNFLALNVSSQWIPPFQLQHIELASCNLGPRFPSWLQTQTRVIMLSMYNASVSDTIPDWFDNVYSHILYLDLSMNQISGKLPKFVESNNSIWIGFRELILKSNKFDGPLTLFPSDVTILDLSDNLLSGHIPMIKDVVNLKLEQFILSNNQLSGEIPTFLCNVKTMIFIDLSRNQLTGRLPKCLGFLQQLRILDVTNNSLHGEIPSTLGSLWNLESLHLRNNRFCGKFPLSLQNLTSLQVLDLGKNAFTGIIPPWIGEKLLNLEFLNLQSNKFHGDIPPKICWLSALQLLNVAQNSITGNIPHCFGNFTAMVMDQGLVKGGSGVGANYKEYIIDSIRGIERTYTAAIEEHSSIDLSNNNIDGEIPEELMNLLGLWKLNLAGNHLNGRIPETIGNLKRVESLDLSKNELSGSIPSGLSDLYFLSHLNLSFNNLSGRIPKGNQLQTLDDQSIYMGNSELCGAPLLKSCPGDKPVEGHDQQFQAKGEDSFEFLWFYAGIGPGFFVGFLAVCCTLLFKKSWRYAYFGLVENVYNGLLLASALTAARLRRKFRKGEFGA